MHNIEAFGLKRETIRNVHPLVGEIQGHGSMKTWLGVSCDKPG